MAHASHVPTQLGFDRLRFDRSINCTQGITWQAASWYYERVTPDKKACMRTHDGLVDLVIRLRHFNKKGEGLVGLHGDEGRTHRDRTATPK